MLHGCQVKSLRPLHVEGFASVSLEFVSVSIEKWVDPLLPNWGIIMSNSLCQDRICIGLDSTMCKREASIGRVKNKICEDVFLGFKKFLLF
jgi:hypothetical protein